MCDELNARNTMAKETINKHKRLFFCNMSMKRLVECGAYRYNGTKYWRGLE